MQLTPRIRAALAGLVAALLAAALLLSGAAAPVSRAIFDGYQRLAPRDLARSPVEVVWIDQDSLTGIARWPWPRFFLAELTHRIAAGRPRAIGFDILFDSPDTLQPDNFLRMYPDLSPGAAQEVRGLRDMDLEFARELGAAPTVLARLAVDVAPPRREALAPTPAEFSAALPLGVARFADAIGNIADLGEVALGEGIVNGEPDADGLVRRVPLAAMVADHPTPGFALELARVAAGDAPIEVVVERGRLSGVAVAGRVAPVDPDGRMRLHLGHFPVAKISSAVDVLQGTVPASRFTGKVVIVGLAAEGTSDIVATPLQREVFGVFVQAQAVDALLRGGWLSRPAWAPWAEYAAAALLACLTLLVIPGRGRVALVPLALGLILIAASWLAFQAGALLLDPLPAAATALAAAAGALAMSFRDTRAEREGLREALIAQQIDAAEAAGELQAARDIQLGMLPPRETLAQLDPRLDIDALLEPARSVGGDFFDVFRLDRDRIAFLIGDVTGKGAAAALFMALSKALAASAVVRSDGDLARAAALLDDDLAREKGTELGVTMIIGIVDLSDGSVSLCNAGHDNPLLVASDGEVRDLAMNGGPPFCAVPDFPYPAEPLRLMPGEGLFLVTDGVSEAQNGAGELFGRRRLVASLRSDVPAPARQLTEGMLAAVRAFEAGAVPSDDVTVLALRWRGPALPAT